MKKTLLFLLKISLCSIGSVFASSTTVQAQQRDLTWRGDFAVTLAQVTTDGTLDTQVNTNGNVAEITGGETRGENLFHSFQDFSVPNSSSAVFDNATDISNIFSRVTGGSISNIDGLIRANGSANLFLINPAGIILGENARLDIGGSFYGSSATSILFEEGEFSAADLDNPAVLTVNAPIGLGFRDEPGNIVNRASTENGLEVPVGKNISFLGGNVTFEGGKISAPGGRVELGGLLAAGTIELDTDSGFRFPEGVERADVSLINGALVKVRDAGGGFINVNARNLSLSEESILLGGIESGSGSPDAQAGDITINAESFFAQDNSQVITTTAVEGTGDAGNIFITATNIEFTDEIQGDDTASKLVASTFGQGNAGDIEITAQEIVLDGSGAGAFTNVGIKANDDPISGAVGDGGNITVNTDSISFLNGARLATILGGIGTGGNITVNANDFVIFDGEGDSVPRFVKFFGGEQRRPSAIVNIVRGGLLEGEEDGIGNAGVVEINTQSLSLTNNAGIFTNTSGQGDAGDIKINTTGDIELDNNARIYTQVILKVGDGNAGDVEINANSLSMNNFSQIQVDTQSSGNAGNILINANNISLTERSFMNSGTGILGEGVEGNAGKIEINTNELFLADSFIEAFTRGNGNAGDIVIQANDKITLDDGGAITSDVRDGGLGTGGNIVLTTASVSLSNGSRLSTSTFEQGVGEAGSINVNASEQIDITDGGSIKAVTENDSSGGNINFNTKTLNLSNRGQIFASSEGGGNAGNINLQVSENIVLKGISNISTTASGEGNGGNLDMNARFIVAFPNGGNGNDITTNAQQGNGGNITINAESLLGFTIGKAIEENRTNDIDASSVFSLDGDVTINTPDTNTVQGATELPTNVVESEETTQQACGSSREIASKNSFSIDGKGGITAEPGFPLDSFNIIVNGEANSTLAMPTAIEAAQGKIQPARGVQVTETGEVILTAYPTDNLGNKPESITPQRLPKIQQNCV